MKYKVGDLVKAFETGEVTVMAHQCNCFCTMGAGVARAIAQAYPWVSVIDKATGSGDRDKMGTFTFYSTRTKHILNLYSQYGFSSDRKQTDYKAMQKCFVGMRNFLISTYAGVGLNDEYPVKIGLPKLGAGLAGGDWSIISEIIEKELVEHGFDVTIYVLDKKEIPSNVGV